MSRRKVFNAVILDLIQIGSIYQYLTNSWHKFHIEADIWENNIRQPKRILSTIDEADKFYQYLIRNWHSVNRKKIKVVIYENDIGAI